MIKNRWIVLILTFTGVAGCQVYHPQSLNTGDIEGALQMPPADALSIQASKLKHPLLRPLSIDLKDGLSPDEAAIVAILVNPSLRAVRDRRAMADAQLLQAGLLPNPQLSATIEPVTGGATADTFTAYNYDAGWDLRALITRSTNQNVARANRAAVELDVAWQEWQVAQTARLAVYNLIGLQEQLKLLQEMKDRMSQNLAVVHKALEAGLMTEPDLSAAETAYNQVQANLKDIQKQIRFQEIIINKALGLPPQTSVVLQQGITLPSTVQIPSEKELLAGLEQRRLDLVALRKGYESQEATVRLAIMEQFPNIHVGVGQARDTSNVITTPFMVGVDIPVFDRNQAAIAQERATRQQLYDEYINRIFESRSEITALMTEINGIEEQLNVAEAALPSLQRLVDAYRRAVDQGQADVLSYYTSWNELTAKHQEIVILKNQLVSNQIALEIATGLYNLQSNEQKKTVVLSYSNEVTQ